MGRAESTINQDAPAVKVFNYYITGVLNMVPLDDLNAEQLDECVHALLSSYSDWLCNTNIPYNAAEVLANPRSAAQPPTNFLKYSTLKDAAPSVPQRSIQEAMIPNANAADLDEQHGGTKLEDIITNFSQWLARGNEISSLAGVQPPQRFKDGAKYRHCIDLLDVSITDEQRAKLKTSLPASDLQEVADEISKRAMLKLNEMVVVVGMSAPKRATAEYSGVGARVAKFKTKCNEQFQTRCLKTFLQQQSSRDSPQAREPSVDDSSTQQAEGGEASVARGDNNVARGDNASQARGDRQAGGGNGAILERGQRTIFQCQVPRRPVGQFHRVGPRPAGSDGGSRGGETP
ncbi:hypothetical protein THAOC_08804 [Thalassiosira oceanica]|uniref:Uncharacterized protein n=1 Tax=Thalassiosira oceanica TaxID=159749 RepID=K0SY47_THAOC|nr:hypothetical protein THAOC_08804 [Thalassiosira oceanica]|eukprot:EJK69899.1 hypothetical protein THAOC_08804 [Thalassiosira oceanica]